jgi:MFS family permease
MGDEKLYEIKNAEQNEFQNDLLRLPAKIYLVNGLTQFALGLHVPFLNAYMVDLGANYAEMGAFRSVGNAAPTILQPLWGAISDKIGHNKMFVAFGTLTGLFIVYLFLWASTPVDMIILYAIQSILFSIQIPTWLSLIGGLMDENVRGEELGKLGIVTNGASLIATILTGYIAGFPGIIPYLRFVFGDVFFPSVDVWREVYYFPFYFTAVIGIATSVISISIKEKNLDDAKERRFPPIIKLLSQPGDFRQFCFISSLFSFTLSIAWPYWLVIQREWLESTLLEIAIAAAILSVVPAILIIPFGRLSDRIGRKSLLIFGRIFIFTIPLIYGFATNVYSIYIANVIGGISMATTYPASIAYVYDVAPEEERGSYLAVFNIFTGVITLFGSLFGGVLGEALVPFYGRYLAVILVLITSAFLRFCCSFFYLLITEPREYSSTVWNELRELYQRIRYNFDRE